MKTYPIEIAVFFNGLDDKKNPHFYATQNFGYKVGSFLGGSDDKSTPCVAIIHSSFNARDDVDWTNFAIVSIQAKITEKEFEINKLKDQINNLLALEAPATVAVEIDDDGIPF